MQPVPETRPPLWRRLAWSVPWLVFQVFPVLDLVTEERPVLARVLIAVALVAFTAAYLSVLGRFADPRGVRPDFLVVVVLATVLSAGLGTSYAGLWIYVSAAAAATLPQRLVWPVTGAATLASAVVIVSWQDWTTLFLPVLCPLTAATLWGTRHLLTVNAELREAREELARNAVAEERLRFARDLHDLLGHSLSLIALKSELAGRLAEADPARARTEMADVEAAARRSLAEVRDAVSGYRQISCAQALAEARAALSGAGISFRGPDRVPVLPGPADAVLGWVVREATTNVLRHSRARAVVVTLTEDGVSAALTVTDDGRGPDDSTAPGSGLTGLSERVGALEGTLTGGAGPRGGWQLAATVPLVAAAVTA
ncbi:sensor histidine kinase [Modestobacter sp. Leaf380]|uniref:sensor histidine kinase n=1 Tax=Modestobacter sp. Leaf380 TaxID=1736356 RepID=UPI0006F3E262|nr:sensor histidine kinase [Modestobacter sp. Leaf380]KQS66202.1 histidine kinase [Modestobacter sp. Leaf380]